MMDATPYGTVRGTIERFLDQGCHDEMLEPEEADRAAIRTAARSPYPSGEMP